MIRRPSPSWIPALLVAVATLAACGPSEEEKKAAEEAAREQQMVTVRASKDQLAAKRQEVTNLMAQQATLAAAATPDAAASADVATKLEAAQREVDTLAETYGKQIVEMLNADPLIEGEAPNPRQKELVRMKSDEDVLLAREYIDKGGDYRGAIDIYNRALQIDPDYQLLKDELAKAERDRYMTKERFDQVQKGMTEAEVRNLLGQVNAYNIKEYPEKNVVAWFYPREGGAAAGVFFQKNKQGVYVAYQLNFEAVKAKEEGSEG
jgi:tetratricopeptide (TPR) repeat protein